MIDQSETILRVIRNEDLAHDWELVLLSQGLSPQLRNSPEGIVLTVPRQQAERALAGLAAYDKENSRKVHRADTTTNGVDVIGGILAGSLLFGFFAATVLCNAAAWLERGSANAAGIVDGEFWRAITALTLHGDIAHALSNGFAMGVFLGALSSQLGTGLAAALTLASGALGNLANAYLQGTPHNAVGASTSVFGAVGMLGSLALMRRRRATESSRRAWVSIAASLALLGMLGSSGTRVDVAAHLLGFLAGGLLGIPVSLLPARPSSSMQWLCGAATIASIVYCWVLALE